MKATYIAISIAIGLTMPAYSDTSDTELEERLKKIIIPRVEFRDAHVVDVIHFLLDATVAASPDYEPDIHLSRIITNDTRRLTVDGVNAPRSTGAAETRRITLNLERISLYELIVHITQMVDLPFEIKDNQLVLITNDGRRITRSKRSNHVTDPLPY